MSWTPRQINRWQPIYMFWVIYSQTRFTRSFQNNKSSLTKTTNHDIRKVKRQQIARTVVLRLRRNKTNHNFSSETSKLWSYWNNRDKVQIAGFYFCSNGHVHNSTVIDINPSSLKHRRNDNSYRQNREKFLLLAQKSFARSAFYPQ